MSDKNLKDIIPGEIIEKRKTSKSHDLPFKYKCEKTMKTYEVEITCMIFIESANIIATSSLDPYIEIWSFNSLELNLKINFNINRSFKKCYLFKRFSKFKMFSFMLK